MGIGVDCSNDHKSTGYKKEQYLEDHHQSLGVTERLSKKSHQRWDEFLMIQKPDKIEEVFETA